ncbi:ankyrin repeat-containing domain protein [Rhodocollybia butyracea]|uniref:Ankyrin repeat-containing domain protein n=1 Tax=Rhodocollybia butyracea TaxID=206335 RepID=A0A9P5PQF1_9AGAR|nr:ankyrin repeat-containing domain protein [Rhodocollybia butyracea]
MSESNPREQQGQLFARDRRDRREQQDNPRPAQIGRQVSVTRRVALFPKSSLHFNSIFANSSDLKFINSQFFAANSIHYHTWNINDALDIQNWLKAPRPSENYVAACDKRTPGTGDWILSHPQFTQWCQGKPGMLWIQGKVGSGKTVLSAAIIEKLENNPAVMCCYYYFDNRDRLKTDARGLLQSLLLQMATRTEGVHPALHELYTKCKQGVKDPTTKDLSATLVAVAKDLRPVFLVLDAMDECSEVTGVFKHLALLKRNLCIAVTSRYLAETGCCKYLQEKFSNRKLKPELSTEIVDYLTEGAQGQFRWIDCQVTVLQRLKTPKAIRDALKKLPNSLEETYTQAFERMRESEHVHDAGRLLMWLAYGFEPLSIGQVTDILAVDLEAQKFDLELRSLELENGTYDILDSTLITISMSESLLGAFLGDNKIVQLAHNSVKEFLTQSHSQNQFSELIEINEHLAHSIICQTCLVDYPLAQYAAKHWPLHMERLENRVSEYKPAKVLAIMLLKEGSQQPYVNWIKIHQPDMNWIQIHWPESDYLSHNNPLLEPSKISTPLYYMAFVGLSSVVEYLLVENKVDVDAQKGIHGGALQAAACKGNKEIVQLLLDHNADASAWIGRRDIVQLLLDYKADVNAQGGEYGNALQAAVYRDKKDIVQLLLDHKADVNAQGGNYGNALQAAAFKGRKDTVQLLLDCKADVNAQGGEYGNALQAAAYKGRKHIVQLLLEHKADAAVHSKNQDIVQLLLDHKADVNAQGGKYGNALQAAVHSENKDIIQLLLDHKADVNAQGGEYGNALQAATHKERKDIVQLLLEHKVDVAAQGEKYALLAAVYRENKDIVKLLLKNKADANTQGGKYGNALLAAVHRGNKDIVQLLLEHKADANDQGGYHGNTAVHREDKDIVQLLLADKTDVSAQGEKYGNALQVAAYKGRKDIVQLLLEHKADVNAQGGEHGHAIQAAVYRDNKDIVQLLLDNKADVNAQGGKYGNALQAAAVHSENKDIIQLLLEHKADVNYQGGKYGNALQAAAYKGRKGIVQLLLEHKANVNAQGGIYGSALLAAVHREDIWPHMKHDTQQAEYGHSLQAAVQRENKAIVQILLEHKADVNANGAEYGTALQAAAYKGGKILSNFFWITKQR